LNISKYIARTCTHPCMICDKCSLASGGKVEMWYPFIHTAQGSKQIYSGIRHMLMFLFQFQCSTNKKNSLYNLLKIKLNFHH